jgi:NAD(P)H-hydrate epimerase
MNSVFSTKEFRKIELETIKQKNLSEADLMYQAGYMLTKDFLSRLQPNVFDEIVIISNSGNNGGDALVMFKELKTRGYKVKIFFIGQPEKTSMAYKHYYKEVSLKLEASEILKIPKFEEAKYIIDGIFGIGLIRDIKGKYSELIEMINDSQSIIYSIDLPSGIHPDSGKVMNVAIKADYTGVLGYYKTGNLLNKAQDYHGEIRLLDIGLISVDSNIHLVELDDIDIKEKRKFDTNKYTYGNLAFVGSSKLPGAINMSALSALRNGSGLASVYYDEEIVRFYPDLLYKSLDKNEDFSKYDVVVFGPGINEKNSLYLNLLNKLIEETKVVVDALSIEMIDQSKNLKSVIITPHLGELSRLLKIDKLLILDDPILHLRTLAKKGLTIILKGATSIVQYQDNTYLLQSRNPGLAKAGTGDVLAGLIGSFYHNTNQLEACLKAYKIHTLASYQAREKYSETGFLASDLIEEIGKVKR